MKARLVALLLALPACAMASPFGVLTGAAIGQVLEVQRQEAAGPRQHQLASAERQGEGAIDTQADEPVGSAPGSPAAGSTAAPGGGDAQDASGRQLAAPIERRRL